MARKDRHIRLPFETDKILQDLADKNGKNITDTIIELIENTKKSERMHNKQKILENKCPVLVNLISDEPKKTGHYCAKNPSNPKKLGDGSIENALVLCKIYHEIEDIMKENNELKKECIIKIPYCTHKEVDDVYTVYWDGNVFREKMYQLALLEDEFNCPIFKESITKKKCMKTKNGVQCKYLKYVTINVQEIHEKIKPNEEK